MSFRDPNLVRVQGRAIKRGDIILREARLREVTSARTYKVRKRRWTTLEFDDGTNLAVPVDHYILVLQEQGALV